MFSRFGQPVGILELAESFRGVEKGLQGHGARVVHGLGGSRRHWPFVAQYDLNQAGKSLNHGSEQVDVSDVRVDDLLQSGQILREGYIGVLVGDFRKVKIRDLKSLEQGFVQVGLNLRVFEGSIGFLAVIQVLEPEVGEGERTDGIGGSEGKGKRLEGTRAIVFKQVEQEFQGEDEVGLGVVRAKQELSLLGFHTGREVLDRLGHLSFDFDRYAPASQIVDFGLQVEIGEIEKICLDFQVVQIGQVDQGGDARDPVLVQVQVGQVVEVGNLLQVGDGTTLAQIQVTQAGQPGQGRDVSDLVVPYDQGGQVLGILKTFEVGDDVFGGGEAGNALQVSLGKRFRVRSDGDTGEINGVGVAPKVSLERFRQVGIGERNLGAEVGVEIGVLINPCRGLQGFDESSGSARCRPGRAGRIIIIPTQKTVSRARSGHQSGLRAVGMNSGSADVAIPRDLRRHVVVEQLEARGDVQVRTCGHGNRIFRAVCIPRPTGKGMSGSRSCIQVNGSPGSDQLACRIPKRVRLSLRVGKAVSGSSAGVGRIIGMVDGTARCWVDGYRQSDRVGSEDRGNVQIRTCAYGKGVEGAVRVAGPACEGIARAWGCERVYGLPHVNGRGSGKPEAVSVSARIRYVSRWIKRRVQAVIARVRDAAPGLGGRRTGNRYGLRKRFCMQKRNQNGKPDESRHEHFVDKSSFGREWQCKKGFRGPRQGIPLSKVNGLSTKRKDFAFDWCWLFAGLALMGFS